MSDTVLSFWFTELTPEQWWIKDEALDQRIRARFNEKHAQAARCELFSWRGTAKGRLAEVIVLDQFSRNMFRDSPAAFSCDALALALAQEAVACGADKALTAVERSFLYMPYMHSESLVIHEEAVRLFTANGIQNNLDFEFQHKAIIEKFGRYPHRNKILGRESTAEELVFLQQPGSSF
ncbi:MAG TPA: DUF924 family protein [Cellvibrio sp.]|nr:DUF924 family protein [Cellvibrio sp.]